MSKEANSSFHPPWWLQNRHIQSCYSHFYCKRAEVDIYWEQLDLPDGDFIDLCWANNDNSPLIILLHGLEGSVDSHYIQIMLRSLIAEGYSVLVYHFRTCSGRLNRLARNYHASDTCDLIYLFDVLQRRYPSRPIAMIGFSLGGNVLLHYLAQQPNSPIAGAIAVSVPFELQKCVGNLPRLYQWRLLRAMKQKIAAKIEVGYKMPVGIGDLQHIHTFPDFDNAITAPLHNFSDAFDYYRKSSTRPLLKHIRHHTLIIQALDDPLVPPHSVPDLSETSTAVQLDISEYGGHVGFVLGGVPWQPDSWFERRILEFLAKAIY